MNISQAIMHLYPQANPMTDFIVQDDSDGNGAYIAHWGLEEDQPTEEELQAAWDELQAIPVTPVETIEDKASRLDDENKELNLKLAIAQEVSKSTSDDLQSLMDYLVEMGVI